MGHVALGIGRELRAEHQVLVVEVEVHTRIIHKSSLMNVDIQALCCLHLQ